MKKYVKSIILIAVFITLGLVYYYYLANRTSSQDATQKAIKNEELAALTTRNIDENYPESVREVVKLYARITKAYYENSLTDEQIETLGKQARLLFDDELKSKQTDSDFYTALKTDIENYNLAKTYISTYKIESSTRTEYKTMQGREYASLGLIYYLRRGDELVPSPTKFTLRKDKNGRWKILYWELTDVVYPE